MIIKPKALPDRVRQDIIAMAKHHQVKKVLLFGSRARGTNAQRSDIDLAISGGDVSAFYWDVQENCHTLLTFDIVNLDGPVSKELKQEIERDGVSLYEEA